MNAFVPEQPFVPAIGLAHAQLQTLFAFFARPAHVPALSRERWETPDDDFLDLDILPVHPSLPHVLILHGLEGSSDSGYVRAAIRGAAALGWGAIALNFRSCSGEPNRALRSYCSGETDDPRWVARHWRAARGTGPLFAIGFSLGANALLKWMAEDGDASPLSAAVAVSPPLLLAQAAAALDRRWGAGALYRHAFLRTLKAKGLAKARLYPNRLDAQAIARARTIEAFDDAVTAPSYGFADAQTYYAACSAGPKLEAIRRPTLIIRSKDDPIVPNAPVPAHLPNVHVVTTEQGGHVGFVGGSLFRPRFWSDELALAFLAWALRNGPRLSGDDR